jgi:hypothetical protein
MITDTGATTELHNTQESPGALPKNTVPDQLGQPADGHRRTQKRPEFRPLRPHHLGYTRVVPLIRDHLGLQRRPRWSVQRRRRLFFKHGNLVFLSLRPHLQPQEWNDRPDARLRVLTSVRNGTLVGTREAGKAFYDMAHAPADHSNRRRTPKD